MCCFLSSQTQQRTEQFYKVVVIANKFAQALIGSRRSLVLPPQQSAAFYELIFSILAESSALPSQLFATCWLRVHFLVLSACEHVFSIYIVAVRGGGCENKLDLCSRWYQRGPECLSRCLFGGCQGRLDPCSLSINRAWVRLPLNYSAVWLCPNTAVTRNLS